MRCWPSSECSSQRAIEGSIRGIVAKQSADGQFDRFEWLRANELGAFGSTSASIDMLESSKQPQPHEYRCAVGERGGREAAGPAEPLEAEAIDQRFGQQRAAFGEQEKERAG